MNLPPNGAAGIRVTLEGVFRCQTIVIVCMSQIFFSFSSTPFFSLIYLWYILVSGI